MAPTFKHKANSIINSYLKDFHVSVVSLICAGILAWRIPGMGDPGGLPSMGLHRVGHDCSDLAAAAAVFLRA